MDRLDLSIFKPAIVEVAGATGRIFRLREWAPLAYTRAVAELVNAEDAMAPTEDWATASTAWDAHQGQAQRLVLAMVQNAAEGFGPETAWEDIADDFPGDAPRRVLGFFMSRWFERQHATDPDRIAAIIALGQAMRDVRATGPTPTSMNRAARRRAATAG